MLFLKTFPLMRNLVQLIWYFFLIILKLIFKSTLYIDSYWNYGVMYRIKDILMLIYNIYQYMICRRCCENEKKKETRWVTKWHKYRRRKSSMLYAFSHKCLYNEGTNILSMVLNFLTTYSMWWWIIRIRFAIYNNTTEEPKMYRSGPLNRT